LVGRQVAVVIAATAGGGTAASLAAKSATTKIPIVSQAAQTLPLVIGLRTFEKCESGTGCAFCRRRAMEDARVGWIAAIIIGGIAGWLAEQFMKSDMGDKATPRTAFADARPQQGRCARGRRRPVLHQPAAPALPRWQRGM
jgi:hypothetical protein